MMIPNPNNILKAFIVLISVLSSSAMAFSATYTVTSTDDDGEGSLREAIGLANSNPGLDLIVFNIPGADPHTIQPESALPDITDSVVIDGYTQPGAAPAYGRHQAVLQMEIDGSNFWDAHYDSCLTLHSDNNTVRGLVINRCDDAGIHMDSPNGGNVIEGNYIGTDVTGTIDLGNYDDGVRIWDSPYNRIGGTKPAERNVISGSNDNGVEILLSGAMFNQVEGNYIGVDASGAEALGNPANGVHIKEGATDNTIGPSNVISGNGSTGIFLDGTVTGATGNIIVANLVGTDAFGQYGLGNLTGVRIYYCDENTLIGNVVSSSYGAPTSGNGFGVNWSNGNIFKDNKAAGNAYNGFQLRNSENNILKDNASIGNAYNGFRLGTGSSFNTLKENAATNNQEDGFSIHSASIANTFNENKSKGNGEFGYFDESSGEGTTGTANTYLENKCKANSLGGSDPTGLCGPQS